MNTRSRPRNAAKGVKAGRIMWLHGTEEPTWYFTQVSPEDKPYLLIPCGREELRTLRSEIANKLAADDGYLRLLDQSNDTTFYHDQASTVLAALGLTARTAQGRRM